jgi:hypothetical protein
MTSYRVNRAGVDRARALIDAGTVDVDTEWSQAAPSAADENAHVEEHGHQGYGEWHLAVDPDAGEDTKKRYAFPYGDFRTVNRAALIHAKQRAVQNEHTAIADAADDLLQRLDARQD